MAYTIIKGQEKFICDTQEEVIYRFFTRTDYAAGGILRFADDELNVTGKDQRNINMDRFSRTYFTVFYHRNLVMRSIMVLDECGRPMDVRDWTEAIRRVESGYVPQKKTLDTPDPLYRRGPCGCGEKQRAAPAADLAQSAGRHGGAGGILHDICPDPAGDHAGGACVLRPPSAHTSAALPTLPARCGGSIPAACR